MNKVEFIRKPNSVFVTVKPPVESKNLKETTKQSDNDDMQYKQ